MKFVVITHVLHKKHQGKLYAYGPYVKEMNLWLKHVEEFILVAPVVKEKPSPIDLSYIKSPQILRTPSFSLTSPLEVIKTLFKLPYIKWQIFKGMIKSDHIHLRLPGNMGLLGSLMQTVFPFKPKTVKYAGNWDPQSEQPWSYRLQKKIVSSSFLTRNAKVLVYGKWPNQPPHVISFFTASYRADEIYEISVKNPEEPLQLLFVGSLSAGKRPVLVLEVANELKKAGILFHLDFYGDGDQRADMEKYIHENDLQSFVTLHGKQSSETVKQAYQRSHFLIFPSKSEGWPKVVMEAMTWKCLPLTTDVSAVSYMLGDEKRGSIIQPNVDSIVEKILFYKQNPAVYQEKTQAGFEWAKQFTLERFENEMKKFLNE